MRIVIFFIKIFDRLSTRIITLLFGLQQLLTNLLPALAPPAELSELIQAHYAHTYRNAPYHYPADSPIWTLEPWEEEVLTHHMRGSGTVLVLGTGVGRESIAIAQKGYRVVGLDIHVNALRWAQQRANTKDTQVWFLQASFLAIPAMPACMDYILLPSVMYSAIPGRQERQTWLRSIQTYLKPQGHAILNFMVLREAETRIQRLTQCLARWLIQLPGANKSYQPGDACSQGHFLHLFATEEEVRSELSETGATILALDWHKGYAVVAWPPSSR